MALLQYIRHEENWKHPKEGPTLCFKDYSSSYRELRQKNKQTTIVCATTQTNIVRSVQKC